MKKRSHRGSPPEKEATQSYRKTGLPSPIAHLRRKKKLFRFRQNPKKRQKIAKKRQKNAEKGQKRGKKQAKTRQKKPLFCGIISRRNPLGKKHNCAFPKFF